MADNPTRILVVDDEASVRKLLRTCLTAKGYQVHEAHNGVSAIELTRQLRPQALLLDLGLPDLDGKEVVRVLREWTQVPVIILSVRGQEQEKVECLDLGADDYLTKPFGLAELEARLRTALRHSLGQEVQPVFQTGPIRVDLTQREVTCAGQEVSLTPTEFDLLRSFVTQAGKVLTHRHLLRQVWGFREVDDLHILRVNISNLRKKLEVDPTRPRFLVTEAGVGYRLRVVESNQVQ